MSCTQNSGFFVPVKTGRKDFLLPKKIPQLGQHIWKGLNSFQIPKLEIKKQTKESFFPEAPMTNMTAKEIY